MLSAHRDKHAARRFLRRLVDVAERKPPRVTTDAHPPYRRAIRWILGSKVRPRCKQSWNNRIEQDQRAVKQRSRPMLGFGSFASAVRCCSAFAELRQDCRVRQRRGAQVPLAEQRRLFVARWRSVIAERQAAEWAPRGERLARFVPAPCDLTEPRAAIDWLNAVTDQSANFFAVELQVWRIEDSKPASQFNLVAQPNEWAKTVRETARGPKMTPTRQLQLDYWTELRTYLEEQDSEVRAQNPSPQHWTNAAIGRSGMHLSAVATKWDDESGRESAGANRVELVLDNANAKTFFAQLPANAEEIGESIGAPLTWHNPGNANMCRIYVRRQVDLDERSQWDDQFAWLRENLECFREVFRSPRETARSGSAIAECPRVGRHRRRGPMRTRRRNGVWLRRGNGGCLN